MQKRGIVLFDGQLTLLSNSGFDEWRWQRDWAGILHSTISIFSYVSHSKHLLASGHKSCILIICLNIIVYILNLAIKMPIIFFAAAILTVEMHCMS